MEYDEEYGSEADYSVASLSSTGDLVLVLRIHRVSFLSSRLHGWLGFMDRTEAGLLSFLIRDQLARSGYIKEQSNQRSNGY